MTLAAGARLGPYEIVSALGAGGMGEVYRARDIKLGREVAIKVLPADVARDSDRVARFAREAQILASLNHPHIAGILHLQEADGVSALVMELVEGETLADRIARGPIPIDEALPVARQICEALEAAHDHGIIHRDLKPANIKITPDGVVKVLDFGLAKLAEPGSGIRDSGSAGGAGALSLSPTITSPAMMTGVGVLLGTAAYMAPEQAKGKPADRRSDIWAFGCVLYEMLTGKRPFEGGDVSDTLAFILTKEPDWNALLATTTASIKKLLRRCLDKDRQRRLADIADARYEIDEALATPGSEVIPAASSRHGGLVTIASVVAAAALAAFATSVAMRPAPTVASPSSRFTITPPPGLPVSPFGLDRDLAIAPDGSFVVYRSGSQAQLVMRRFDRLDAQPLAEATTARQPSVSPDSRWVVYVDTNFTLKKVAVSGGSPIALAQLPGSPRGVSWIDNQNIVVATSNPMTGLLRVPSNGGDPVTITTPDRDRGELGHWWPSVLPGGRALLFTVAAPQLDKMQIAVLDLETGKRTMLLRGGSDAQYVASGHMVYAAGSALLAVPFDLARLSVAGDPVRVVEGVSISSLGVANAAVTHAGTLVYVPTGGGGTTLRSLMWVDRQGHETLIPAPARAYVAARLSPDGARILLNMYDQESDLWVWDLVRRTLTRLTFDPAIDLCAIWTPDGRRVVFASNRAGAYNPYVREADGTGADVHVSPSPNPEYPTSMSPDGFVIGYERRPQTGNDIIRFAPDGKSAVRGSGAEPLLATPASERNAEVSPDGHFLAYDSDESGQYEVYVRPYPQVANGRWQVSTGGGTRPAWTSGGTELVYMDSAGHLTSVLVQTSGATFTAGAPAILFSNAYAAPDVFREYDVSPDGRRFVMIKEGVGGANAPSSPNLVVVEHWFDELARLVPTTR